MGLYPRFLFFHLSDFMYAIHEINERVVQITLSSPANIPLPFGYPYAVYVIRAATYAMVDTGFSGSRVALLAALSEINVRPEQISKILLTQNSPNATGNISCFPRAMVVGHGTSRVEETLEEITKEVHALLAHPKAHSNWSLATLTSFLASYRAEIPADVSFLPIQDEFEFPIADHRTQAFFTPGVTPSAVCYHVEKIGLFVGPTLVIDPAPFVLAPHDFATSVAKLTKQKPDLIFPAFGGVVRSAHWHYRSISLYANNLLSNVQFVLKKPRSPMEVIFMDLGSLPSDLIRFAATVSQMRAIFDELLRGDILSYDATNDTYLLGK